MVKKEIPIGLSNEIIKKAENILKLAPEFNFPILVVHGEEDMIADPKGSKQFIETVNILGDLSSLSSVQVVIRN